MIDVKKLITGFLILTLGASTATWVLSNHTNNASVAISATQNAAVSPLPENAFVSTTSSVPADIQTLLAGGLPSSTALALNNPNNLTATLGNSILNGLIAANPNGIQTDSGGNNQINLPDQSTIISEIIQNQSAQNVSFPNWNLEVMADQSKIKRSSNSSNQGITNYLQALNNINNKYFVSTGLMNIANAASTTDPSNISASPSILMTAGSELSNALADSLQLSVPASMVPVQKAWIRMLVYQKDIAGALQYRPYRSCANGSRASI